ncbi:unnamed protein product (macronuclear) [Paramecium tetraurelia]|uniref:Uncharacterized protein n=1 Tax=Paramecium tetraurelia TaxID=5888 RepID=A0BBS0_PARTE|nr:uncharacterized protein GSPATT00000422001 [Paramecium tetraurelia]CAK55987.1 unnamed protein product [Paramecium tetraurelia]|eukprot:XP_001423385.1 hypothetical protein (macronuclear) [Paramecium tetraurelia strain d4-2]
MSRRNSLEKIPQSAHSARNQGRGLNIIDFLTKQNFQDKAPSTILFSDEVNKLKSCDMCLQLQNELDQHVKSDRFQQVIEKLWQKFRKIEDENQKVLIKVGNLERSLIEQQELLQAFNSQFISKYGLEKPQQQYNYATLDQEQLDRLERKISKDAQKGIKNIEDNLFKNLNKEIQAKFNLIQDYQLETNLKFTSIFSQIDLLNNKSEIADKINTIEATLSENNKLLNSNKLDLLEMQKQYSDVDSDLIKVFQHIKTLLQTNYKIDLMEQSLNNLKLQFTQIRDSLNEVEDLVSKI